MKKLITGNAGILPASIANRILALQNLCIILFILLLTLFIAGCTSPTNQIHVTGITLDQASISLEIGEQTSLTARVDPTNATNQKLVWSSSDETIAVVDANGKVSALGNGQAIISVSTTDGRFRASSNAFIADYIYEIDSAEQWHRAIEEIKNYGDNRSYLIHIMADFELSGLGENEFTFGDVISINMIIYGNHTISLSSIGSLLRIGHRQNVTIRDIVLEGIEYNEKYPLVDIIGEDAVFSMWGDATVQNNSGAGVWVQDFARFILKDNSKILNNVAGIALGENSTFYMEDNALINNNGERAVSMSRYSAFYMSGGVISGHNFTSKREGCSGVQISGTFIMSGGLITDNETHTTGGAVFVGYDGTFILDGGSINGNIRDAVHVSRNGSFTMLSGEISNNTGSGVELKQSSVFTMQDGVISDNAISGVLIFSGNFNMLGGSISGNTGYQGGGVFIHGGSSEISFLMSGGVIYGSETSGVPADLANVSRDIGAALYVHNIDDVLLQYGDGTDILPHIDGFEYYTDYTIEGRSVIDR